MEEGSVVANRVERGEYRGLTTNEVIVCVCAVGWGGGVGGCISEYYRALREIGLIL